MKRKITKKDEETIKPFIHYMVTFMAYVNYKHNVASITMKEWNPRKDVHVKNFIEIMRKLKEN
jgi:hypothetical protein